MFTHLTVQPAETCQEACTIYTSSYYCKERPTDYAICKSIQISYYNERSCLESHIAIKHVAPVANDIKLHTKYTGK